MRSQRTRAPLRRSRNPPHTRSIFINCPFDDEYQPILRAMCFAILTCGCVPRCALDFSDSGAVRLHEIVKLVSSCGFSIHDISRVQLDSASKLPRFNMPLELGVDLGLKLAGPSNQRTRRLLVLDAEKHRYDKTLSDISGMDIEAHGNDPVVAIKQVRDWLNANRGGKGVLPGSKAIADDYLSYQKIASDIIRALRLDPHEGLQHRDYLQVVKQALPLIERARG